MQLNIAARKTPTDDGKVIAISSRKLRDLLNRIYSKFWT